MTATPSIEIVTIAGLWALATAGVFAYCMKVAGQITYVTLSDGRRQERRLPFAFRLLLPFAAGMRWTHRGNTAARAHARADRQLISAGLDGILSADEFLSLRLLVPLIFGGAACALLLTVLSSSTSSWLQAARIPGCLLIVLMSALQPSLWLREAIAQRHRAIRRALPFLLDILTLSVEAGMDFMTALQRHVERAPIDPLVEELMRMIREIQLGKIRRDALRAMSLRVDFADLKSVVNALVQADELGVSIGTTLRVQADQIRQRRFERAERLANEAPMKMLFPLIVFIFPCVLLILMGPVIMQIFRQGF
jgi:tight adherence protein C